MGDAERKFVEQAFDDNWISPLGPHLTGFEQDIQRFTGAPYAAALSSGTAAIHLALEIMDIGPGDVVFVSSFTFSASVNPILYQGALPVLIDSESDTWNMDPVALEQAIRAVQSGELQVHIQNPKLLYKLPWLAPSYQLSTFNSELKAPIYPDPMGLSHTAHRTSHIELRPKAILPVHLYGMPANLSAINRVAKQFNLPIIEDAAEALGSTYKGQHCGTYGNLGVYSFNGNKIITTGGGGALIAQDLAHVEKAKFLATQARDQAFHYQHSEIGYNYRLGNVAAGIGRGQMMVLPDRIKKRQDNFNYYKTHLGELPGVTFQELPSDDFVSNRWLTALIIDPEQSGGVNRYRVAAHLQNQGIDSRPLWKPMHLQPIFADLPYFGSGVSSALFEKGLCIPSGSNLSDEEIKRVVEVLRECWIGVKRLV